MSGGAFFSVIWGLVLISFVLTVISYEVSADTSVNNTTMEYQKVVNGKLADIRLIGPGLPPETWEYNVNLPDLTLESTKTLDPDVPTMTWSYGCSATSATMYYGYYDRNGYPNMYIGPTNGGIFPLTNAVWGASSEGDGQCPLTASQKGLDDRTTYGHKDDYYYKYGSSTDPYYGNWNEHSPLDSIGDFMGTNQYIHYQSTDGGTWFINYADGSPFYDPSDADLGGKRDGIHGMKLFAESRGYSVIINYNQYIYGYNGNTKGFTYDQYKAEIDAGYPVLIQVKGHTMLGVGYSGDDQVILHDTWDYSSHTMTWGGYYSGMLHYAVGVLHLTPVTATYTITASAGSGGNISPSGSVMVPSGGNQTFAISPDSGYSISDVLVDNESQGKISSYPFTNVVSNHTISATFTVTPVTNYTILATSGPGGSIIPSGSVTVPSGGNQTFVISPDSGYSISDVLVDNESHGTISSYSFTNVVSNHTISATFTVTPVTNYTILATSGSGGSISPSGSVTVPSGGNQTFAISPDSGYSISDVLVDNESYGKISSYSFTNVVSNHTISATFTVTPVTNYTILATAGPGGSIIPSGSVTVPSGGNQTFVISPDSGYSISDVLVDNESYGKISSYSFTSVVSNHTISATFTATPVTNYTILATTGSGGSIIPSGSVMVPSGGNQTFVISPDSGYSISDVLVDNESYGKISSYSFTNVVSNHTISATFTVTPVTNYTILATSGPGGSISPSGSVTVPSGGNQTFAISPDSGYSISDVLVDNESYGKISSYSFTSVVSNHTISATFTVTPVINYTILATSGPGGSISPSGSVTVPSGGNQTFVITNNLGMNINDVIVDNESKGAIRSYTFTNVLANHTITASFKVVYPQSWYINATAGTGGIIDPSGLVRVFNGYNTSFSITALSCYNIADVIINNTLSLGSQSSPFIFNFTNVTSNQSIEAKFTRINYKIKATAGTGGTISPSGEVSAGCGDTKTFTISPDTNNHVSSVLVDGENKGALLSYTFDNITADHSISATFSGSGGNYTINASADAYTLIYPHGTNLFDKGDNQTYLTQAKPGSDLLNITVDNNSNPPAESWTFSYISTDHNISTTGQFTPGQVHVLFTLNQTYGEAPLIVKFTDQSFGDPLSYYWQFGDGYISTEKDPVHLYQTPGVYTVTLRASNNQSGGVGVLNNGVTVTG